MTARKPKPRKAAVRKRSKATLAQRVSDLERLADWNSDCITVLHNELEALQTRKQFRDASHDEQINRIDEMTGKMKVNSTQAAWLPGWPYPIPVDGKILSKPSNGTGGDEPVSNAGEAIGMSDCNLRPELDARAIEDAWNLAHPVHPRWWQFWRRP